MALDVFLVFVEMKIGEVRNYMDFQMQRQEGTVLELSLCYEMKVELRSIFICTWKNNCEKF